MKRSTKVMVRAGAGVAAVVGIGLVTITHGCGTGNQGAMQRVTPVNAVPVQVVPDVVEPLGWPDRHEIRTDGSESGGSPNIFDQSQGGGGGTHRSFRGSSGYGAKVDALDGQPDGGQANDESLNGFRLRTGNPAPAAEGESSRRAMGRTPAMQPPPADQLAPLAPAEPALTPAEFALQPGQELWVIERPLSRSERFAQGNAADDTPGSATLMTRWDDPDHPGAPRDVAVPLTHTDVHASIAGPVSSVRVTQQYHNPFGTKIEAVYVFPLPDDAAVNDFVMTIGARSIRGVIREREQARQVYEQARGRGYHASLMTQERSNIFTQQVANIEPNESIDIDITYFHTLGFREGGYEFVFPMVVGPRFNPCGTWTGMGSAPVYAAGGIGQRSEVQYLRAEQRSGHDVSLTIDVDAGVPIESIESPSHSVVASIDPAQPGRATARLSPGDSMPNRDFVLRYRVAGDRLKGGLITHRDERGGFFSLVLVPPSDLRYTQRGPVELVFVVDCSGSMSGQPLALAQRAVVNAIGQLRAEDTFQIVRFSDTCSFMTERPIAADGWGQRRGIEYAGGLRAGGGTMLLKGLEPALNLRGDWNRTRFVCILTDGLLGNDPDVLEQLKRDLGDSRIFSIGFGSAPNRTLLNAMARLGRGAAAYVANERDADDVTNLFIERVSSAAMTDLRIDWGDMDVSEVYPKRTPDLFVGRPVVLYGRCRGDMRPTRVRVSGRVGRERQTMTIGAAPSTPGAAPALPLVWARAKMTELDEHAWSARVGAGSTEGPNKREVRDLALSYGLMSAYTSFVAVDSSARTAGGFGTTVPVPVNMPRGVRYETTVGGR